MALRDHIHFLQINLNHCADANNNLSLYVDEKGIDVILVKDPYFFGGIPGHWRVFFSNNLSSAIIIINQDYRVVESMKFNNSVFVNIKVHARNLIIGSQYTSPSSDLSQDIEDWKNVFEDTSNLIIGGDFNVPLLQLGYVRESERTDILLNNLMLNQMVIVNDSDAPHSFTQGRIRGRLDLTIAGINIVNLVDGWTVDDKIYSYSDHRYVLFDLGTIPVICDNKRFKTKNKSFTSFNDKIKQDRQKMD